MDDKVLLLDLESVLDIRAGVLRTLGLDPKELEEYLSSAEYNHRDTDDLKYITKEKLREVIKTEDNIDHIKNARPTYLLGCIYADIITMENKSAAMGKPINVEVWVNIYPFKLFQEEIDFLQAVIFTKLRGKNMVSVVNISPEELTPVVIKTNNIDAIYMYNCGRWLQAHGGAMMETDIKATRFHFAPTGETTIEADKIEFLESTGVGDLFTFIDMATSSFVTFNHLIMPLYSEPKYGSLYINNFVDVLSQESADREPDIDLDEEDLDGYLGGHVQITI